VSIKRAPVQAPGVEARVEAAKVGVVRINSLTEGEAAIVQKRVQELQKQGAQKLVLDLRGVAGGSLAEGVRVANFFIKDGALAQTIGRGNKSLKTFNADPKLAIFDGPMAVLIDRGTAGAAEVVASAFIERKRGEVVGEKSFGAGAEQQLFPLRNGDGLLLTTVKWASSTGKSFIGAGVSPTVEVKRPELAAAIDPEDLTGNDDDAIAQPAQPGGREVAPETAAPKQQPEDTQLKKALELLNKPAQPTQQKAA